MTYLAPLHAPLFRKATNISEPVPVHFLQKFLRDRIPRALADNGINAAMGTEGGILPAVDPMLDLCGRKNAQAIKAAADLVPHQGFFVIVAVFVCRDDSISRGAHSFLAFVTDVGALSPVKEHRDHSVAFCENARR